MSYRREYTKIYETYVNSRKKHLNEDMEHMVPGPGEVAVGDNGNVPQPEQPQQQEVNPNQPPEMNRGQPPMAQQVPPVDEKQVYIGLVQQITMQLMKANNLTQQEIDNVLSVLNKAQFVA